MTIEKPAKATRKSKRQASKPIARESSFVKPLRNTPVVVWPEKLGLADGLPRAEPSTTRQVAGLHLAIAGAPTTPRGLFLGVDAMTGWAVYHDHFQAYNERILAAPNVIYIGDVGLGKSTAVKCWEVLRPLMLGRRVIVIDKKNQEGCGEYTKIARALGVEPIRFVRGGGGTRINILDPSIGAGGTNVSQTDLLFAVLAEALGRPLKSLERKALQVAHSTATTAARAIGRVPTLVDVTKYLLDPLKDVTDVSGVTSRDQLITWGRKAGFELERLISPEGDLYGLIDGATSENVTLRGGLTVFDISQLPDDGPVVRIVMAIIDAWITATLDNQEVRVPTHKVTEEGWYLVDGAFAKATRRHLKLARGLGLANATVLHHVSDVAGNVDAEAVVKEAGVVVIFGQKKRADAEACVQMFGFSESAVDVIMQLPVGSCIFKRGTEDPIMLIVTRSDIEAELADTDGAMTATGTLDVAAGMRHAVAQLAEGVIA